MSTQAQVTDMEFDLGGPGGPGLLWDNEVTSTPESDASGRELTPGIRFDADAGTLEIHLGWGAHDAVGGQDLSAPFSAAHIHGPASVTENASPLYNLVTTPGLEYNPADPGATGTQGFIDGVFTLVDLDGGNYTVAEQVDDLLAGLWYVNVHSEGTYATGEIRGQLQPVPEPETYAMMAALGLLGFGVYRRCRLKTA